MALAKMKTSVPERIIAGAIRIESVEAFASVLRQHPERPELLRMYADLLAANAQGQAAARHYDAAARLFLDAGRLFQAWVSKLLQWRLTRPSRDQLLEMHQALGEAIPNGAPVDAFVKSLSTAERMAVFAQLQRTVVAPGETVLKAGARQRHLFLVVTGVLKETAYEMVSDRPRFRREGQRLLWEADCFGDVYPFSETLISGSEVVANTRAELVMLSRQRLMRACRRYPDVEKALIRLCRIRFKAQEGTDAEGVRKGERYRIPVRMRLDVLPQGGGAPVAAFHGFSYDLSVSGASFVPAEDTRMPPRPDAPPFEKIAGRDVRLTILTENLSLTIGGRVARKRSVLVGGRRRDAIGIRFLEIPPRLRGVFFAFAEVAAGGGTPAPRSPGPSAEPSPAAPLPALGG